MKPDETEVLINYRLEQAQTALDDARYLSDGQRSRLLHAPISLALAA
jgi:hypothetical protein